ncbi:MAG: hypothetical protein ABWZ66_04685 [Pyrinomonadaceae bacterium]
MNELEEVWTQMMNKAINDARDSGRHDVAEYLTLKATNDFIRAMSVKWLFDSMNEIFVQSRLAGIKIENENPHRFAFNRAHMVGSRLSLRQGVRCLSIEAGWTRTPADGFMRGGALAAARITHFGISTATEEVILLRKDDFPQWFSIDRQERKSIFDSNNLQKHFQIFTGS